MVKKEIKKREVKQVKIIENDFFMGHPLMKIDGKMYIGLDDSNKLIEESTGRVSYEIENTNKFIEISKEELKAIEKELDLFVDKVYAKVDFKLLLKEALKTYSSIEDIRKGNSILDKAKNLIIENKPGCHHLILRDGKNKKERLDIHMF